MLDHLFSRSVIPALVLAIDEPCVLALVLILFELPPSPSVGTTDCCEAEPRGSGPTTGGGSNGDG